MECRITVVGFGGQVLGDVRVEDATSKVAMVGGKTFWCVHHVLLSLRAPSYNEPSCHSSCPSYTHTIGRLCTTSTADLALAVGDAGIVPLPCGQN